jgi:endonuclease/exonuclease/phosphatase family metal-dependent hydrolase
VLLGRRVLALALATLGAFATAAPGSAQQPAPLRVLSFNIRYGTADDGDNHWRHRKDLVVRALRESGADVVGLQEALAFQVDEILEAVPDWQGIGTGRDDGERKGEMAAVLWRRDRFELLESGTFWLSDTPEVPGSTSWGNSITRICTWARLRTRAEARSFYVFNAHLDHRSAPSRLRAAELIAARIASREHQHPVVLTGDLNAGEGSPPLLYLRGEAVGPTTGRSTPIVLVDTFRTVHPEASRVGTFNGFTGAREGEKIDYVLVAAGEFRARDAAIERWSDSGRYPSDHFPVSATLEWTAASPPVQGRAP